jgi:hypothetical protein
VDAERTRLGAVGERRQEIRELGVGAMRSDKPLDVVASIASAPLTHDLDRRLADSG